MMDSKRVWGYKMEAGHPDGHAVFVWCYVDLSGRPDPDPIFELVAGKLRAVPALFGPTYGQRIIYSVVVLGCEPEDQAEEYAHQAYVRMWSRQPGLWESVRSQPYPVTFWMVGSDNHAFFGVIQPALGPDPSLAVDWEQFVGHHGVSAGCFRYFTTGIWGWMTVPQSIDPEVVRLARAARQTLS